MPAARGHPSFERLAGHARFADDVSKREVTVKLTETTIGGILVPILVTESINPTSSAKVSSSSSASSKATSSASEQSSSARSSSASSASQSSASQSSRSNSSSSSSSATPSSHSSSASSTAQSSSSSSRSTSSASPSQTPSASATPTLPSATILLSQSATPTPTAFNSANASASTAVAKKGLSGGAIGAIVAGSAAVLLLLIVYFVRKRFLHKRQKRLDRWAADAFPSDALAQPANGGNDNAGVARVPSFLTSSRDTASIRSAQPPMQQWAMQSPSMQPLAMRPPSMHAPLVQPQPIQQRPMQQQSMQRGMQPSPVSQQRMHPFDSYMQRKPAPPATPFVPLPAAPPMAYNNPAPAVSPFVATQYHPLSLTPSAAPPAGGQTAFALVKSAFVPRLPDELSVSAGEMVRVIAEFDDGWARCANLRGEQGAVPTECLQRQRGNAGSEQTPAQQGIQQPAYVGQGTGDWRMSQRESSLYPA